MTAPADRIRQNFRDQAVACADLGSPFTARLCALLADLLTHDTPVGEKVLTWPGDASHSADSVPLRLCGTLHGLVRAGQAPALAPLYPPAIGWQDEAAFAAALGTTLMQQAPQILAGLRHAPQTNEVRRTAALLPGFLTIARETGLPLWLSELGCSAGLNLLWDQFRVTLDGQHHGPGGSTVEITPEWRGTPPPVGKVSVVGRRGVDLNPLDVSRPFVADRLMAYIWPDQADRLQRTQAAIELFNQFSPGIDQGDAVTWLETRLGAQPAGACHVVYHTIAWQYFPAQAQARGAAMLAKAGEMATAQTPLAHLAMEADGAGPGAKISLTIWPGGDARVLGRADFHGRWVEWAG